MNKNQVEVLAVQSGNDTLNCLLSLFVALFSRTDFAGNVELLSFLS